MSESAKRLLQAVEGCLAAGSPCTAGRLLAQGFTWDDIEAALHASMLTLPDNAALGSRTPLLPTRLQPELWNKVARVTRVPVPPPRFDTARGLYYWTDEAGTPRHFAVLLIGLVGREPAALLVPIDEQLNVVDVTGKCWEQDIQYVGQEQIQHACRDAHQMNAYGDEGALEDDPPWLHPADELPLAQREP